MINNFRLELPKLLIMIRNTIKKVNISGLAEIQEGLLRGEKAIRNEYF